MYRRNSMTSDVRPLHFILFQFYNSPQQFNYLAIHIFYTTKKKKNGVNLHSYARTHVYVNMRTIYFT